MSGIAQKEAEQWAEELNQAWLEERTGDKKRVRFPEPRGLPISFSPDGQQAGICAGPGKEPVAAPRVAVPVTPAQPKRARLGSESQVGDFAGAREPGQGSSTRTVCPYVYMSTVVCLCTVTTRHENVMPSE